MIILDPELLEILRWYADQKNYRLTLLEGELSYPVVEDFGDRARAVLARIEHPPERNVL